MKTVTTSLIVLFLAAGTAFAGKSDTASDSAKGDPSPQIEVMDIPTADILDPMTYATAFRFYNEGGLMSRLVIGPLKRVNLGISFDAQRVIGAGDPHMVRPAVYFKLRFFDGSDILPAMALGYDNQGFLYQENNREFLHREKGLYLVASHDFSLLAEYDNIRKAPDSRVNLGGRYWIAPYFNVDFGARNVGRGVGRGAERILRLNYVGHFSM